MYYCKLWVYLIHELQYKGENVVDQPEMGLASGLKPGPGEEGDKEEGRDAGTW